MKEDYNQKRYHRPSDHYDESWELDGAIDDLQLLYRVGRKLAAAKRWPTWKPGSEFKIVRENSLR